MIPFPIPSLWSTCHTFLPALLLPFCAALALGEPAPPSDGADRSIPLDQIGAEAGEQYSGDGVSITPTSNGARLRAVFQDLEGWATCEGLWLESTSEEDPAKRSRFRVRAMSLGRAESADAAVPLAAGGRVCATSESAVFVRPGLVEEYFVSMDGVRQDFVVPRRPAGTGELRLGLDVTGARAEAAPCGVKLTLDGCGRELAYSRLRVSDATGRELTARFVVRGPHGLEVRVDDHAAAYPVRIDPTFSDADWFGMGGLGVVSSSIWAPYVYALATDAGGNLYIGGLFSGVGPVAASNVAKWDGDGWSPLGAGTDGKVQALAVMGSEVYAGGDFTTAGAVSANNIARWNGDSWTPLTTGTSGAVVTLASSGPDLYAGGFFTTAGGVGANYIAKWNGGSWSALGSGLNSASISLAVSGNDLYVGGRFTNAGGVPASYVAKWNGGAWSALGSGMDSYVLALAVSGADVYAGGHFTTAGGIGANRVARWDGSSWSALGSGIGAAVRALAVSGSDIYAGGDFTTAGGIAAGHVARWDGSSWSPLGSGTDNPVKALAVSGTELYAAGDFTTAGGVKTNHIARWGGGAWSTLGSGLNSTVKALAVSGTDLYVGGNFTGAGGIGANHIAKWDGASWSALGSGMDAVVRALAVWGGDIYAGGDFTTAGFGAPWVRELTAPSSRSP